MPYFFFFFLLLKPEVACSDSQASLHFLGTPASSQQHIFGTFIETGGMRRGEPLAKTPQDLPLPLGRARGVPTALPALQASISLCCCQALMFPGGRSFSSTVECCFYTRFISTVSTAARSCSPSMPWMEMSARRDALALTCQGLCKLPASPAAPPATLTGSLGATEVVDWLCDGLGRARIQKRFTSLIFTQAFVLPGGTSRLGIPAFGGLGCVLSWAV